MRSNSKLITMEKKLAETGKQSNVVAPTAQDVVVKAEPLEMPNEPWAKQITQQQKLLESMHMQPEPACQQAIKMERGATHESQMAVAEAAVPDWAQDVLQRQKTMLASFNASSGHHQPAQKTPPPSSLRPKLYMRTGMLEQEPEEPPAPTTEPLAVAEAVDPKRRKTAIELEDEDQKKHRNGDAHGNLTVTL